MTDTHAARAAKIPAGGYGIVAVAASAGGITALGQVLQQFPDGFPVAVLVVQHLDPRLETRLPEVLSRDTELNVKLAEHGERPRPGTVYLAPPDRHLLLDAGGALALSDAEQRHFVRPSADHLFESAVHAYGARVLACMLTGTGRDGADGIRAIGRAGGTVIVQDPSTARFGGMPQAALDAFPDAVVLPLEEIGAAVRELVEASTR